MFEQIRLALSLLDNRSQLLIKSFALIRILVSGLDSLGVVLVGLLLTKSTSQLIGDAGSSNFLNASKILNNFSLIQIAAIALLLFISKSILSVIFTKVMFNVLANAEAAAATKTFNLLINGGYKNFANTSSQDLIFSLNRSATDAINGILSMAITIISESFLLISIGVVFIFVDAQAAIAIVAYFALVGFATNKIIGPRMQSIGEKFASSSIDAATALNDTVIAYREIHTLRKYDQFVSKYAKGRINFARSDAFAHFYSGIPRYIVESALMLGALLLTIYIFGNSDAAVAAGELGIFLTGSVRIMASMLPLQNALNNFKNKTAVAKPFFDLVAKTQEQISPEVPLSSLPVTSSLPMEVKLDHVSYTYPGSSNIAVNDVSIKIKPGEFNALIGPSGSGKSTIADLLIKLIEPTSGSVEYTNNPGSGVNVGYVPQSPGIISGTILENITLNVYSKEFDEKQLTHALESAHLTDLVASLKEGVNTDLGAQSDGLSGGQMQRIGLARALYANPGFLVLDEATSALDAETEAAIAESLHELKGQCSIVVIAHRLSTVQNADCVYVIDNGEIVASGKFSDLAKSNELVARYVELSQLKMDKL